MARFAVGQAADAIPVAPTRALNGLAGQSLMPVVPMGNHPKRRWPGRRRATTDFVHHRGGGNCRAEATPAVTHGSLLSQKQPSYNPAVTEMAVTRILASEDDDFATTKNKSGFSTSRFRSSMGAVRRAAGGHQHDSGGINCWDDQSGRSMNRSRSR